MTVSLVAVDRVDAVWPHIAEMVIDGIEKRHSDMMPAELWMGARSGNIFLLIAHGEEKPAGLSFWRFIRSAQGPVLNNMLTAGEDMESWLPEMNRVARDLAWNGGAKVYRWEGPKAWGRIFPQARITTCSFEMKVDDP